MMEVWDLYDKDRIKTGKTMYRGDAVPDGFYRMVVHIAIFNSDGRMLIQQRQPFKSGWSGMWDITVGGSAVAGENGSEAAHRELFEEIGIDIDFSDKRPNFTLHFNGGFDDVYLVKHDVDISRVKLQQSEVASVKFATKEEIYSMIDNGEFIPYHKSMIDMMFFLKDVRSAHTASDKSKTKA